MSRHAKVLITVALFLIVVSLAAIQHSAPDVQPNVYAPAQTDRVEVSQHAT